ncbi:hypothetical protein ACKI1I_25465 [Streptomyces turgidiscabies]|uniref:hypothetical protein n=1 Tax=Streptomyces turgidiscabies TaxID=85558 RepID=UPI0038F65B99
METKDMNQLMVVMEKLCLVFGQSDDEVKRIELRPGVIRFVRKDGWLEFTGVDGSGMKFTPNKEEA